MASSSESLCIDITSTPTFPQSDSYETVEVEANSSYTNSASLKMAVPSTETLPVTISRLKVVGLPENLIATYFLPSGEAYDPFKKEVVVQPGEDGPSVKISGRLSDIYDNNRIFKISVSFSVTCGASEVSEVELTWFAIKTKKTSSTNTFLIVSIIGAVVVLALIAAAVLFAYHSKNKNKNKRGLSEIRSFKDVKGGRVGVEVPPLQAPSSLYYKFI